MNTVRGLEADTVWRPALRASARATVGSSFEHAINLELDGALLTLVTVAGRRAPGAFITDARSFPRVTVGTRAQLGAGSVDVGKQRIDATGAGFFSCEAVAVPTVGLRPDPEDWSAALLECAVPGSFVPAPSQSPFDRALRRRLAAGSAHFQIALGVALHGGADPELEEAVRGLIGLGVGLTPSGDDYLVGSLAALHHLGTAGPVVSALGAVVSVHSTQTTTVSRHFLRAAAEGRFHHDIARAATSALVPSADVTAAFEQVAAIGSTSGTDVLHGLVDTLSTCLPHTHLKNSDSEAILT